MWTIRQFKPSDLERVMYINRTCLPENYSSFFFIDIHQSCPDAFLVAELNGEVVGYIMCRIELGLLSSGRWGVSKKGHVVSIAVLHEHRRKGIGYALMCEAMKNMHKHGARECYLEVRVSNAPAINLYKKLGFNVVRVIRSYYANGEDAYLMARELPFEG